MLDKELEQTLNTAFKAARDKRHEFMTVEHLLLALIDNKAASGVMAACGVSLDSMLFNLLLASVNANSGPEYTERDIYGAILVADAEYVAGKSLRYLKDLLK